MNILWTGFEPFGDFDVNPSWTVAQAAAARSEGRALELPVLYDSDVIFDADLDLVVHLGLGADREQICLERVARNHVGDRPDNDGVVPEQRVRESGPERHETPLSLQPLAQALSPRLEASKLPGVRVSDDCGDYVCNARYYRTLHRAQAPACFVHIPRLNGAEATRLGDILGAVIAGNVGQSILPEPAEQR